MKKKKIEGRKWEELPIDCLVNVLGRLGLGSLLVEVPFVCKSWYKASLDPLCWKQLVFPPKAPLWTVTAMDRFTQRWNREYRVPAKICETKFVKNVIDRSADCATMVDLRFCCIEGLAYIAEKCPALKKLVLWSDDESLMVNLSLVIGKFKYLESLEIIDFLSKDVVTEIGAHCKNFVSLSLDGYSGPCANFGEEEAMAIVTCLPKIQRLTLTNVCIERENMIKILKGCVELVHLDVSDCRGFDEDDEEILKLASHIPSFDCSESYRGDGDDDSDGDSDGGDSDGGDSDGGGDDDSEDGDGDGDGDDEDEDYYG